MMKSKASKRLLALLLAASFVLPVVQAHAKKTFLMPRAVGVNKAMEFTPWDANVYDISQDNKCIHSRLQVAPFYQHSTNKADIGKYFGIGNCKNSFTVGARYDFTQQRPLGTLVTNPAEVDGVLMSGNEVENQSFSGTVHFNPDQEVWGARVDWEYFHNPQKGLYIGLALPFASVTNSMNMCVTNDKKVVVAVAGVKEQFNLADYFAGNVTITDDPEDRRDPLVRSKIGCNTKQSGLADLDAILGYRHNCHGIRHFGANIRVTIPTGNHVNGCDLFEAVLGNGHHVGLGFGVDAGFQVWECRDSNLWVEAGLRYKYLFEATEVRMLGVQGFTELPPLAHYMLMGRLVGDSSAGIALFPAANELTREVDVTPGSCVDALLAMSYHVGSFVGDLGYNLYFRSREKVCVQSWQDNTVGILSNTVATDEDPEEVSLFLDSKFLNRENLDECAAATPAQLTHKLHAGFAYRTACCCCPVSVGLGASYEFASSNAALDQYAVWLKGSVNF